MPTIKLKEGGFPPYVGDQPVSIRAMNVLIRKGLTKVEIVEEDDDSATLSFDVPEGYVDDMMVGEQMAAAGIDVVTCSPFSEPV